MINPKLIELLWLNNPQIIGGHALFSRWVYCFNLGMKYEKVFMISDRNGEGCLPFGVYEITGKFEYEELTDTSASGEFKKVTNCVYLEFNKSDLLENGRDFIQRRFEAFLLQHPIGSFRFIKAQKKFLK